MVAGFLSRMPGAALVAVLAFAAPASAAVVPVPGSPCGLGKGGSGRATVGTSPNAAFTATATESWSGSGFLVASGRGRLTAASGPPTKIGARTAPASVGFSPHSQTVAVVLCQER